MHIHDFPMCEFIFKYAPRIGTAESKSYVFVISINIANLPSSMIIPI